MTLTHEVADLTPELAQQLLDRIPEHQRRVTPNHVRRLAQAMRTGQYLFNPQPVILDTNGHLMDGQHRCHAVIESGVTVQVVITRGADPDVFSLVDTGRPRLAAQFVEGKHAPMIAAAARAVLAYRAAVVPGVGRSITQTRALVTNKQVLDEVAGDPEYRAAADQMAAIRKAAKIGTTPLLAVHILASRNVDPDVTSLWLSGLETGEDLSAGDPRLVLRNRYIQDPPRGETQQWAFVVKAWNAHVQGNTMKILRWRARDEALPTVVGAAAQVDSGMVA